LVKNISFELEIVVVVVAAAVAVVVGRLVVVFCLADINQEKPHSFFH